MSPPLHREPGETLADFARRLVAHLWPADHEVREPPPPRPESEVAPWRAVARACPWRIPLSAELAAQYRSCQCREPADCLQGKATARLWVGLDTECRRCVEDGGPPPQESL